MEPAIRAFAANARAGLADENLRAALAKLQRDTRAGRPALMARLPEFESLRVAGAAIKDHTLANLAYYLEAFEGEVNETGGTVHWCRTAEEARDAVLAICRQAGAKSAVKGKSMISEEIALNEFLAANGIDPVETDLGEYILQLRHEAPSHIVMPAIHLDRGTIAETLQRARGGTKLGGSLATSREIVEEARATLRARFLEAEVGITGANFLIAESGTAVIVTNEGNGDLAHTLPPVHIVLASIEKLVPRLADALTLVRLLARSATGQEITSYTSFVTGPRRASDADGPRTFHVVLLDNGRSRVLAGPYREILRCIRCRACQSVCPVYGSIGGHAYGWVYAGPVGAVLNPALLGIEGAHLLPKASTLCGACEAVCPVSIPLPALLRRWREAAFKEKLGSGRSRTALRAWAFLARHPALYHLAATFVARCLKFLANGKGRLRRAPLASAWTRSRDLPAPEGGTFVEAWRKAKVAGRP